MRDLLRVIYYFIIVKIYLQIEVMVPPAVQAMPREGIIDARKGQDLTLRCSGRGNPNPRITWSKKVIIQIHNALEIKPHCKNNASNCLDCTI